MYDDDFLRKMEFGGFFFSACLGVLLYYLYELSGHNLILGFFAPLKSSGWETLKLFYYPYGIYALIEYSTLKRWYENIPTAKLWGLLTGMVLILSFWFGCDYLLSSHYPPLDLMLFLLGTAVAYLVSFLVTIKARRCANWFCTFLFLLIGACFIFASLFPDLVGLTVCKNAIETLKLIVNVGKCRP